MRKEANDTRYDTIEARAARHVLRYATVLLMIVLGATGAWGQNTAPDAYYVFKYGEYYLAHQTTTDGTEICVENTFSAEKCLWEYTDEGDNAKYLKTYGADYWLHYNQTEDEGNYTYTLMLKDTKAGWLTANATDGISCNLKQNTSDEETPYFVCYDTAGETPCWILVNSSPGNKALAVEVTLTDHGEIDVLITPSSPTISTYGTYTNTAVVQSHDPYMSMSIESSTYYYYNNSTHSDSPSSTAIENPTLAWSLSGNGVYAAIDPATGTITVTKLPAEDVTMQLTCTYTDDTDEEVVFSATTAITLQGTGSYVIKDDRGIFMLLSGTTLGAETAFNPNCVWTRAAGENGATYSMISGETTYYLSAGNNVATVVTNSPLEWSGVTPQYLKSTDNYFIYRDNDTWKLTTESTTAHRVKASPVITEQGNYTTITASIEGDETIDYSKSYDYSLSSFTGEDHTYQGYTFDGAAHYWYEGIDHISVPANWGTINTAELTKTWDLLPHGNGYADVNEETGQITVTTLPTSGTVMLTLQCTVSKGESLSYVVTKAITLLPEAVETPTISANVNGERNQITFTLSSGQNDIYYTAGYNELSTDDPTVNNSPANNDPTIESQPFNSENGITITSKDIACVKVIAAHNSALSDVVTYHTPYFSAIDGTTTVVPLLVSHDYATPEGMTAYIVKRVTPLDRSVVISPIAYIPQGVPVLLIDKDVADNTETTDVDETHTKLSGFQVMTFGDKAEATPAIAESVKNANLLTVADGKKTVKNAQIYMYYQGKFVLTLAGTPKKGRFFLYNPNYQAPNEPASGQGQGETTNPDTGGNPASLHLVIEEPTGIDNATFTMHNAQSEEFWYTLDGRRLNSQPTHKGLYINNGKKIVIK